MSGPEPPIVETQLSRALGDTTITGTPDVVKAWPSDWPVVYEWKSGQETMAAKIQGTVYLWLTGARNGRVIIGWLRSGQYDVYDISAAELHVLEDDIRRALATPDLYRGGGHCKDCGGAPTCETYNDWLRTAGYALVRREPGEAFGLAEIARLYPARREMEKALERFDVALKAHLRASGGEIALPDGRVLALETRTRQTIDPRGAAIVIGEMTNLDPALALLDLSPALRLNNREFRNLIQSAAPKGQKREAYANLKEKLAAAGAITESPYEVVTARLKGEVAGDEENTIIPAKKETK